MAGGGGMSIFPFLHFFLSCIMLFYAAVDVPISKPSGASPSHAFIFLKRCGRDIPPNSDHASLVGADCNRELTVIGVER